MRALLQERRGRGRGLQRMLALHGADHEVGFAQGRGVAAGDGDIERAGGLAQRRAARILVERGVDGDQAARGVVAGPRWAAPAAFSREAAGDRRARFAKTEQRDDAR